MIRTTIAAAALASAGMGLVMLAPDADHAALADGTDFITVDGDTQLDDALETAGLLDEGAVLEPVTFDAGVEADAAPEPDAADESEADTDGDGGERDGRGRGGRDGRADR